MTVDFCKRIFYDDLGHFRKRFIFFAFAGSNWIAILENTSLGK